MRPSYTCDMEVHLWKQVCGHINGLGNSVIRIIILFFLLIFHILLLSYSSSCSLASVLRFLIIILHILQFYRFRSRWHFPPSTFSTTSTTKIMATTAIERNQSENGNHVFLFSLLYFLDLFHSLLILLRLRSLYSLLPLLLLLLLNLLFLPILLFTILRYCLFYFFISYIFLYSSHDSTVLFPTPARSCSTGFKRLCVLWCGDRHAASQLCSQRLNGPPWCLSTLFRTVKRNGLGHVRKFSTMALQVHWEHVAAAFVNLQPKNQQEKNTIKKHKKIGHTPWRSNSLHNAPALYLSYKLQLPNSNEDVAGGWGIVEGTSNFPVFPGWHVPHLNTTTLCWRCWRNERELTEGRYEWELLSYCPADW
jgi:hypothetical protein